MRTVALALCLAACNAVFDLHETELNPPDDDSDGVDDRLDNCPTAANPAQEDRDADGFGDACDFCPDLSTAVNHDEDGDLRGDACDACPMTADFPASSDADELDDACDFDPASVNTLLLFDPFLSLGGSWQTTGTPWRATGDTVVVTSVPDEGGLANPDVFVEASKPWQIVFGITATEAWTSGDRFGIELIEPASGAVAASCMLVCGATCDLVTRVGGASTMHVNVPLSPIADMRFQVFANAVTCNLGAPGTLMTATIPTVTPRIVGHPKAQVRYFAAAQ